MSATIRGKLYEIEEPAVKAYDLCHGILKIILFENLVSENNFRTAFNEINSQPTGSDEFSFLQAQQQSIQDTQRAVDTQ